MLRFWHFANPFSYPPFIKFAIQGLKTNHRLKINIIWPAMNIMQPLFTITLYWNVFTQNQLHIFNQNLRLNFSTKDPLLLNGKWSFKWMFEKPLQEKLLYLKYCLSLMLFATYFGQIELHYRCNLNLKKGSISDLMKLLKFRPHYHNSAHCFMNGA